MDKRTASISPKVRLAFKRAVDRRKIPRKDATCELCFHDSSSGLNAGESFFKKLYE